MTLVEAIAAVKAAVHAKLTRERVSYLFVVADRTGKLQVASNAPPPFARLMLEELLLAMEKDPGAVRAAYAAGDPFQGESS